MNKKSSSIPEKILKNLSGVRKPDNMSLVEWQVALRKKSALENNFSIEHLDNNKIWGDYKVTNPATRKHYKVAFRGVESDWNYCSCMDFKTNRLGTCKHLEAVRNKLEKEVLGFPWGYREYLPPYTSVFVNYKKNRIIQIRIGQDHRHAYKVLANMYFNAEEELKPECYARFEDFLIQAKEISPDFRCYEDVLEEVIRHRQNIKRQAIISEKYPDGNLDGLLKTELYPFQKEGILKATKLGRCLLADDMGLGKTIQAIGFCELLKKEMKIDSVLIVCPTTLIYQWENEIKKFTNSNVIVINGGKLKRREQYEADEFYKIVSYNMLSRDFDYLDRLDFDCLIMDEAQRVKNWTTKISKALKQINTEYALAITGTPLENKLDELFAIVQFIDQYTLGPAYEFLYEHQILDPDTGKLIGYKNLEQVAKKLNNLMIRRKKRNILSELPERVVKNLLIPMTIQQKDWHDEFKTNVARLVQKWQHQGYLTEMDRRRMLLSLSQMRMVSDSTFVLDQQSRFDTKVEEATTIVAEILSESYDEKIVIFSQWERMCRILAEEFTKRKIEFAYLHGGIPTNRRIELINYFNHTKECKIFLSTDAGSAGLNLQTASYVINIDIPWNPAILEQRIGRIERIGQTNKIVVINFVSHHSIEERILNVVRFKSKLTEGVLDGGDRIVFLDDQSFGQFMETVTEVTQENIISDSPQAIDRKESKYDEDESVIAQAYLPFNDTEIDNTQKNIPQTAQTSKEKTANLFEEIIKNPDFLNLLIQSLIWKDPETQQSYLHFPINDKEQVKKIVQDVIKKITTEKK